MKTEAWVGVAVVRHLTAEEVEDAVRFVLNEDRIPHLVECKGCQVTVNWQRAATHGFLNDEEYDWRARSLVSLTEGIKRRGNGLIYAVPEKGAVSKLAMLPFQASMIIKIG